MVMLCPHGGLASHTVLRPVLLFSALACATSLILGLSQASSSGPNAEDACPSNVPRPFLFSYGDDITTCGWSTFATSYRSLVMTLAGALLFCVYVGLRRGWESWVQQGRHLMPFASTLLGGAFVSDMGDFVAGRDYCSSSPDTMNADCSAFNAFLLLLALEICATALGLLSHTALRLRGEPDAAALAAERERERYEVGLMPL